MYSYIKDSTEFLAETRVTVDRSRKIWYCSGTRLIRTKKDKIKCLHYLCVSHGHSVLHGYKSLSM